MENSVEKKESPWIIARRGIKLLLNDRNKEAESLFVTSPPGIQITAGICFVTFMNALMCFDDRKVTEAIGQIKKIEEECVTQIGWMKSFKNKIFTNHEESKSLEQTLEEKIVLADSLVCQSFLTFLHNDFTSYMKGGWTLRRAWKVYQHTYEQLTSIHQQMFGNRKESGWSPISIDLLSPNRSTPNQDIQQSKTFETDINSSNGDPNRSYSPELEIDNDEQNDPSQFRTSNFYSCSSKTFSDFSALTNQKQSDVGNSSKCCDAKEGCESNNCQEATSSVLPNAVVRPNSLCLNFKPPNGDIKQPLSCDGYQNSMHKSVSLFSSLNNFSSAIFESASSLIGFNKEPYKEWQTMDPETVLRLMSAVSFGYGVFRLCVSLAPPGVLRWVNMLGFEGDQSAGVKSLHYSRKGTDMRAPLASLTLLWYHTIVRPFFNLDGASSKASIEEATKILNDEVEYADSALFLFFKGRVERLKPNIEDAIQAYRMSIAHASIMEVKLLGLHEVAWCYLLTLDYKLAHQCFLQLKQNSKWSKSFYAYLTTICAGAMGDNNYILTGKNEIKKLLEKSANKGSQIEKYIRCRTEKLPEEEDAEKDWAKDVTHWQLHCFEMLYLWNTFPSCKTSDLLNIVNICTPKDGGESLSHEPINGLGWLIKGAALIVIANRLNRNHDDANLDVHENPAAYFTSAVEAFRTCLQRRSKCSNDAHVSAFAQYELAVLLLRNATTRLEGKNLLMKLQYQYKDYDFEHRLNVLVNSTLKSLEKYESQQKHK
ncbi:tetratricopeptide repeat protein 39C-like [Arctopsyche grandis]|uniref:tetratricopeptide repeat protein 39C-like n=1 Tax=Arctopsyche grandis TaxID=121162 RepID=UPI00406D8520